MRIHPRGQKALLSDMCNDVFLGSCMLLCAPAQEDPTIFDVVHLKIIAAVYRGCCAVRGTLEFAIADALLLQQIGWMILECQSVRQCA